MCDELHPRGSDECPARRLGSVVAKKYRLERILGAGGIGAVFEATHLKLGRSVAVKLLHAHHAEDRELGRRFVREARQQAAIVHPGIVAVHDAGQERDGTCWLEMEKLEGTTLFEHIHADEPLSIDRVVALARQILDVLAVLHERGIVHRDLKSSNIFVCGTPPDEQIKIIDFGFVKVDDGHKLTTSGSVLGTVLYMSPEQLRDSSKVDVRSDIFSMGVILYEMLTGSWPADHSSKEELRRKIVQGDLSRHPKALRDDVPEWLDALVARSLAVAPGERFETAREMKHALDLGADSPESAPASQDTVRGELTIRDPAPTAPTRAASKLIAAGSDAVVADPRAYLQQRVVAFTRALFYFITVFSLMMCVIFAVVGPPTENFFTSPQMLAVMVLPSLLLAAIWRHASRGTHSSVALRVLEVVATAIPCAALWSTQLFPGAEPAGGTTGIVHLAVMIACVLVLRAAAVPSRPLVTVLVTATFMAPSIIAGYARWNSPHVAQGMTVAETGALTFGMIVLFVTATTAVVSRLVHRLETTARNAMQLGQYTLEERIGEGGMGVVYRARHALLRRPTAVKLLPPERSSAQAIARFEREVQHTSLLTHPNTVAIYDFGRTPDGIFYYAMEYLDGVTLDELVDIGGPIPSERVIHVMSQVAAALAEAHASGLVHRDIKPANVMLCDRGGVPDTAKVLDFGLVKDVSAAPDTALTAEAAITGTPLYMAPEALIDPKLVDAQTDLYALGAVGYYLLCGEPVFEGRSLAELCGHHLHTTPKPPSERLGVDLDPELEAVILSCLEKEPAARPASAEALGRALRRCAAANAWSQESSRLWWDEWAGPIQDHRRRARLSSPRVRGPLTVAVAAR